MRRGPHIFSMNAARIAATNSRNMKRERQVFNTVVIILSLFFVCHAPVAGLLIADFAVTARSVPLISAFKVSTFVPRACSSLTVSQVIAYI